jgi:hypothetical protein
MSDNSLGQLANLPYQEAQLKLENKSIQEKRDGIPVFARTPDSFIDSSEVPLTVVGHCDRYDLSEDADRVTYADLCAQLASAANFEKLFEQHIVEGNKLLVYITYLEYIKIVEEK